MNVEKIYMEVIHNGGTLEMPPSSFIVKYVLSKGQYPDCLWVRTQANPEGFPIWKAEYEELVRLIGEGGAL